VRGVGHPYRVHMPDGDEDDHFFWRSGARILVGLVAAASSVSLVLDTVHDGRTVGAVFFGLLFLVALFAIGHGVRMWQVGRRL
jgi:cell division protein FtsW (lipid II flippase)